MTKEDELPVLDKKVRFRRIALSFCVLSVLFSSLYVWQFWRTRVDDPGELFTRIAQEIGFRIWFKPVDFYHRVWLETRESLFDQDKLKNFDRYEHLYDSKIVTLDDAVKYSNLMLKSLDDPFTQVCDTRMIARQDDAAKGFYSGVGMIMAADKKPVRVRMTMENSPARKAGIKPGDEILSVDGMDCNKIPATQIGEHTRKHMDQVVKFVLRRKGAVMEIGLVPIKIKVACTKSKVLDNSIGYERIESFIAEELPDRVEQDLRDMPGIKALILDLRGNPGGSVDYCLSVASLFLDKGDLITLKSRIDRRTCQTSKYTLSPKDMNIITFNDQRDLQSMHTKRKPNLTLNKPVYVLIDKDSASAAEMLAGILRDNARAVLCGTRSYGKGVAQVHIPLPESMALSVTSGRYYMPKGQWVGDGRLPESIKAQQAAIEQGGIAETLAKPAKPDIVDPTRGLVPAIVIEPSENLEYGSKGDNQLSKVLEIAKENIAGGKTPLTGQSAYNQPLAP